MGIPVPQSMSSRNICRKLPPRHLARSRANKRLARVRQSRLRARPKCILRRPPPSAFFKDRINPDGAYTLMRRLLGIYHVSVRLTQSITSDTTQLQYTRIRNIDWRTDFRNGYQVKRSNEGSDLSRFLFSCLFPTSRSIRQMIAIALIGGVWFLGMRKIGWLVTRYALDIELRIMFLPLSFS